MKASIIIRAYNEESTIGRAVESAIFQDFDIGNFEVVVVNDGSTDRTEKILRKYESLENMRIFTQENQGAVAAGNFGFTKCKGEYIVLLDGDDYFERTLIKELSKILDSNQSISFVYSDYYEEAKGEKVVVSPENVFETIAGGVMFRKSLFDGGGFWRADLFFPEYELFLRNVNTWKGFHCEKPLFTYCRRKDSLTGIPGKVEQGMRELRQLYPDQFDQIKKIRDFTF